MQTEIQNSSEKHQRNFEMLEKHVQNSVLLRMATFSCAPNVLMAFLLSEFQILKNSLEKQIFQFFNFFKNLKIFIFQILFKLLLY